MNILVTGGTGFIGTYLVSDLLKAGHKVLIYDKSKSESYPDLSILADIQDKEKLASSMSGVDVVYHLAAEHRDDVTPVSLYYDVNVGGAKNVVAALNKKSIKTLIFISTAAVYGINSQIPNEDTLVNPFNDYGKSKYMAELVFDEWAGNDDDKSLIIVRPTVVFGENNRGNVYNLLNQIASNKFILIGNGKNKKSMAYVRNITKFLTMLLEIPPGKYMYNYADKPDLTMEELIDLASTALGKNSRTSIRIPYRIGLCGAYVFDFLGKITGKKYPISSIRVKKFCADTRISALKVREMGFIPPYSLAEGLYRMITEDLSMTTQKRNKRL